MMFWIALHPQPLVPPSYLRLFFYRSFVLRFFPRRISSPRVPLRFDLMIFPPSPLRVSSETRGAVVLVLIGNVPFAVALPRPLRQWTQFLVTPHKRAWTPCASRMVAYFPPGGQSTLGNSGSAQPFSFLRAFFPMPPCANFSVNTGSKYPDFESIMVFPDPVSAPPEFRPLGTPPPHVEKSPFSCPSTLNWFLFLLLNFF